MVHVAWLVSVLLATAGTNSEPTSGPASQSATQPAPGLSTTRVEELIGQLGDRKWDVRNRATAELKTGGPELFDRLAAAYQATKSHEVRLRIKGIAAHIFLTNELKVTGGFLGVRQRLVTSADDPRIPEGQAGIMIAEVLPGTAAAAAGLTPTDVILGMNGQAYRPDEKPEEFGRRISKLPQGTKVVLTVLRGDRRIDVPVILGPRPPEYSDHRSEEFVRTQQRFGSFWRTRFDPNDRNLNTAEPARPEAVWPDRLPDVPVPNVDPGE